MSTNPTPETARALLWRHGLPEDVIDGALCLHGQELAGKIRTTDLPDWYEAVDTFDNGAAWAAGLVDPTVPDALAGTANAEPPAALPAAVSVAVPPTGQTALRDRIAEARDRLRGMALSLATGEGPLVAPDAFRAALDEFETAIAAAVLPPTADDFTAADLVAALRSAGEERDKLHEKELAELRRKLAASERIRENADFHLGQEMARRQLAEKETARLTADRTAVLNAAAQHLYTALFPAVYDDLGQKAAEGVNRAVSELRRVAAEAQQQGNVCTCYGSGKDDRACVFHGKGWLLSTDVEARQQKPTTADGATLEHVRRIGRRLAAHAVGFQDVLDDSDRGPWGRTVGADIDELIDALTDQPAVEAQQQPDTETDEVALFRLTLDAVEESRRELRSDIARLRSQLWTLAAIFEGFSRLLATSSRDWGQYAPDAWLYAVICGWDCEKPVHDGSCTHGAMEEMQQRHGWDNKTVAKARRYRAAVRALTEPVVSGPRAADNKHNEAREVVHGCPPDGSGLTPCCGRTPFELPLGDRISSEAPVTCSGAAVSQPGKEA